MVIGKQRLNTEVGDNVTSAGQNSLFSFQGKIRNDENKPDLVPLEQRLIYFSNEDPENTVSQ